MGFLVGLENPTLNVCIPANYKIQNSRKIQTDLTRVFPNKDAVHRMIWCEYRKASGNKFAIHNI